MHLRQIFKVYGEIDYSIISYLCLIIVALFSSVVGNSAVAGNLKITSPKKDIKKGEPLFINGVCEHKKSKGSSYELIIRHENKVVSYSMRMIDSKSIEKMGSKKERFYLTLLRNPLGGNTNKDLIFSDSGEYDITIKENTIGIKSNTIVVSVSSLSKAERPAYKLWRDNGNLFTIIKQIGIHREAIGKSGRSFYENIEHLLSKYPNSVFAKYAAFLLFYELLNHRSFIESADDILSKYKPKIRNIPSPSLWHVKSHLRIAEFMIAKKMSRKKENYEFRVPRSIFENITKDYKDTRFSKTAQQQLDSISKFLKKPEYRKKILRTHKAFKKHGGEK